MSILSLPAEFNFSAYLGDYMSLVGLMIPIAAAFMSYGIVKKIMRKTK